jgi:methylated-DNA-[protein]-cysteine S-methyltransferase
MRNYSKTGGQNGKPGFRTSSMFRNKVIKIVSKIALGKTLSYKKVAELAGSPKAYRAVGNILSKNYNPNIPCHRVIRSDGKIGGYNRGEKAKKEILKKEKDFR